MRLAVVGLLLSETTLLSLTIFGGWDPKPPPLDDGFRRPFRDVAKQSTLDVDVDDNDDDDDGSPHPCRLDSQTIISETKSANNIDIGIVLERMAKIFIFFSLQKVQKYKKVLHKIRSFPSETKI